MLSSLPFFPLMWQTGLSNSLVCTWQLSKHEQWTDSTLSCGWGRLCSRSCSFCSRAHWFWFEIMWTCKAHWDICQLTMSYWDCQDFCSTSSLLLSSLFHFRSPLLCVGGRSPVTLPALLPAIQHTYIRVGFSSQPLTQPHASSPATPTLPRSTYLPPWTHSPTFGVNKWTLTDFSVSEFCFRVRTKRRHDRDTQMCLFWVDFK